MWVRAVLVLASLGPACAFSPQPSRACVVRSAAALGIGLAAPRPARASDVREQLERARAQLDPVEGQIAEGNWDGVRNVVKQAPLANSKALISAFIKERGEAAEDLVVTREDLVQSLSMLDMAVYNNVFVNEEVGMGKKGNGVKVDRATPLGHLRDAKSQLDEVLALAKSG